MALLLAGISDDFTGGLELASMMARDGLRSRMLTKNAQPEDLAELDVAVVALKSRVAPVQDAVRDFAKAMDLIGTVGARQVFFKYCATFDSTPRGNIGPCADYLAERIGTDFTGFCPAFPDVKRTVYQGHLFYADQLISDSPKRLDPLTPMRDPNLVRVLQQQTRHKVGLLRHEDLLGGTAAIHARIADLKASNTRYVISDATDNDDLARLAEVCVDWPLMTGGSSVAESYPAHWRAKGLAGDPKPPMVLPPVGGPAVVLAGSCSEQTTAQLKHFAQSHLVLTIDLLEIAAEPALLDKVLAEARRGLKVGSIAIAIATTPEAIEAAQKTYGRRDAGNRIEQLLGGIAVNLHRDGVRRFVIAGGETSGAILEALNVRALDISPYLGPGTARAVTHGHDPISFHLKPGKLGSLDMLDRVTAGEDNAS
ncbi:MAG: 3-oxo-tetronate kinase [Dongiaceae bacterium]